MHSAARTAGLPCEKKRKALLRSNETRTHTLADQSLRLPGVQRVQRDRREFFRYLSNHKTRMALNAHSYQAPASTKRSCPLGSTPAPSSQPRQPTVALERILLQDQSQLQQADCGRVCARVLTELRMLRIGQHSVMRVRSVGS